MHIAKRCDVYHTQGSWGFGLTLLRMKFRKKDTPKYVLQLRLGGYSMVLEWMIVFGQ